MKIRFFVGIDISKKTLDFAVRNTQRLLFHLKVENSSAGIDTFKSYCQERQVALEDSILCCEHTGIYSQHVLSLATQEGISLWLESSTRIKRSIGLQRGKSDKIDAIRISEYAFRYADQAKLWQPEREVLLELKHLVGLRKRLMLAKDTLQVPLKEAADFQDKKLSN